MGGLRDNVGAAARDTVTVGSWAMDSISPKRMPCARRSALQRREEHLQGFECNVETAQGSVTGNRDMSTDSEKALKSAIAQQPVSIIEAVTPTKTIL